MLGECLALKSARGGKKLHQYVRRMLRITESARVCKYLHEHVTEENA